MKRHSTPEAQAAWEEWVRNASPEELKKITLPPLNQVVLSPSLRKTEFIYSQPLQLPKRSMLKFINIGKTNSESKTKKFKRHIVKLVQRVESNIKKIFSRPIILTQTPTLNELANLMNVEITKVISFCMSQGNFISINDRCEKEDLEVIASYFGFKLDFQNKEPLIVSKRRYTDYI